MSDKEMRMGVIVGNRGFFPDQWAKSGREEMMQALAKAATDFVLLNPRESKPGWRDGAARQSHSLGAPPLTGKP